MSFISEFSTDIRHIKVSASTAGDGFSCIMHFSFCNAISLAVHFPALAKAQKSGMQLAALRASPGRLLFDKLVLPTWEEKTVCGTSTGNVRPFVSLNFHRQVFEALHNISYPGIRATQRLVLRPCSPGANKESGIGPKRAFHASDRRSSTTPLRLSLLYRILLSGLTRSTLTSWVSYHHFLDKYTYSLVLIG